MVLDTIPIKKSGSLELTEEVQLAFLPSLRVFRHFLSECIEKHTKLQSFSIALLSAVEVRFLLTRNTRTDDIMLLKTKSKYKVTQAAVE